MAFDREKLFQEAQQAVTDNNLFFIEDIISWLPCNKTSFYKYFPAEVKKEDEKEQFYEVLDEGEEIGGERIKVNGLYYLKAMLDSNKIRIKSGIRKKLYDGTKAAELIALYKLICTKEERNNLSMQRHDHVTNDKDMPPVVIHLGVGVKPEEDE